MATSKKLNAGERRGNLTEVTHGDERGRMIGDDSPVL
jgi:hypothetical protein